MGVGGDYKFDKVCQNALVQVICNGVSLLCDHNMLNNDCVKVW